MNKTKKQYYYQNQKTECKPIIKSNSLVATEQEKLETSKTLYRDCYYRIGTNVSFLRDTVRKNYYLNLLNHINTPNLKILHIGCGLGILSMLMAKQNSSGSVLGIGTSAITPSLAEIAADNSIQNISFYRGRVANLVLENPNKLNFDVVLSEWMDTFLVGKPRKLKETFTALELLEKKQSKAIYPNYCEIYVTAISDKEFYAQNIECWSNVYGFTMHSMKDLVAKEISYGGCIPKHYLATDVVLAKKTTIYNLYNQYKSNSSDLGYEFSFSLTVTRPTTLHYLTVYTTFGSMLMEESSQIELPIKFQVGYNNALKECSMMLSPFFPVQTGDVITGTIEVKPLHQNTDTIHSDILCITLEASITNTYGHFVSKNTYYHSHREDKSVEES